MHKKIEQRPWGDFSQFTENEPSTVKIITVLPQQELSLQKHSLRSEFWHIILGNPIITIGSQKTQAQPGDEFTIDKEVEHRIQAQDQKVEILEISFGQFSETDIIRLEDKYGRA